MAFLIKKCLAFSKRLVWPVVLLAPLLGVLWLWLRGSLSGVVSPGPVAAVHARFDCAVCHRQPWGALGDEATRQVEMDRGCARCHGGHMEDSYREPDKEYLVHLALRPVAVRMHDPHQLPGETHCSICHEEHKGEVMKRRSDDAQCVRCHGDLPGHTTDSKVAVHPTITAFVDGVHPAFGTRKGGLVDQPKLRFSHADHFQLLDAILPAIAEPLKQLQQRQCAFCHVPEANGRHMKVVAFDKHCVMCHSLNVNLAGGPATPKVVKAVGDFHQVSVPHGVAPAAVKDVLNGRLVDLLRQAPELLAPSESKPGRVLPGRSPSTATPVEPLAWIEKQLDGLQARMFNSQGGCRLCHVEKPGRRADSKTLPEYETTDLCQRQLPFAKFSHLKHDGMSCTDCRRNARTSTQATDVLTPGIQTCLPCHSPSKEGPQPTRSACIECHAYHGTGGP